MRCGDLGHIILKRNLPVKLKTIDSRYCIFVENLRFVWETVQLLLTRIWKKTNMAINEKCRTQCKNNWFMNICFNRKYVPQMPHMQTTDYRCERIMSIHMPNTYSLQSALCPEMLVYKCFPLLAYAPEKIYLLHCICICLCTAAVVYM